ncbi:MAG: hypothetical protein IJ060_10510 [Oscillospiraceae bacterium]|nr:hypothetical protein [Oscillospiraceae bacterium]
MFGLRMRKMLCAAGAAMLCCAALTACGKEEKKITRYRLKTEIATSNSCAKSIYTGVQSALTDMNAEDADMSGLKGQTFNYTSRDFQFDGPPQRDASAEEKFRYRVYIYFTDITKMDNISISLSEYCEVQCVAVKRTEDKYDTEVYGTHPHQLTIDDFDSINSMNDAVAYAKRG